jgi:DnaD/phage-associated family protein
LAASSGLAENQLKQALRHATEHKVLLSLKVETDKRSEEIFFINDSGGRKALESIQQGGVGGLHPVLHHDDVGGKAEIANIFRLYEENIGLLTPMIAEELREAERLYPWDWIESAFREAVTLNKRNWKYISRILERWATEGKDDGKTGRYSAKRADREKYVRGKYGHLVKR